MSGWLTKAAGAFRGEPPEQPAPFESVCECGVRHSGVRRRKPQRIICRSCGAALFVLPRDSYPTPLAPPPRPKKRRKKSRGGEESPAPAPFEQVATNVFQASERVGRSAANVGLDIGARLRTWVLAFLALWTPLRLILLGSIAVCAATVAYVLLVDRSEQAVLDLKASNEAARKALQDRQIDTAYEQLSAAVTALDKLDRHSDPLACAIRQLHREAGAIRDALPISPLQVVAEADQAHERGEGDEWQQTFRTQYRHRWVIIDTLVQRQTNGPERGQSTVSLPLRVGPQRRSVSLNVSIADLDRFTHGKPRAAVFAAQLAGCDLSADRRTWRLRVNSQTAFLWGTLDNYEAAGFVFDGAEDRQRADRTLAAQRRVIGLADAVEAFPGTSPRNGATGASTGPAGVVE